MGKVKILFIELEKKLDTYPWIGAFFVFLFNFVFFASISFFSNGILFADDHFFLFKFATLIKTNGLDVIKNFDWLYYTQARADHTGMSVSLFQYMLIPFTFFKDTLFGLKVSDAFWASMSMGLLYYVFRKCGIRYSFLFLLCLFANSAFMARMDSGRAFVLVVSLVFLELYLAVKQKYFKLFAIFLLHTIWHEATFFLPIIIALIVETSRYLVDYKCQWRNILVGLAAPIIGMSFFPDYPRNIFLLGKTLIGIHANTSQDFVRVEGSEVYPLDIFRLFSISEIFLLLLLIAMSIVVYFYIESKKRNTCDQANKDDGKDLNVFLYAGFIFALFAFAGTIIASGRLQDFYYPSIAFLLGITMTKLFASNAITIEKDLRNYFFVGVMVFFTIAFTNSFIEKKQAIAKSDLTTMENASGWISDHSKSKDLVFLVNWGDFPLAFFNNDKNIYTMGGEPHALLEYRPDLYWKWYNIFAYNIYCDQPRDCGDEKEASIAALNAANSNEKDVIKKKNAELIVKSIKEDFGARFILSNGPLNEIFPLAGDMIKDTYTSKSVISGAVIKTFELN